MNGITYYRTASPYSGDFTKNCSLNGLEIDSNFLNLEGRDIKSIVKDGDYIKFVLYNGNVFRVKAGSSLPPLSGDQMVSVTYNELVSYRNNEELIPGMKYRITDYRCTTTQANTQSENHQFDVIVMAVSENELNEEAKAIMHSGDTYFAYSNLDAWELKYCLDNNNKRFDWADTNNGKGVIYYMKDEWNNECGYDFKNIQFARYEVDDILDTNTQLTNNALTRLNYSFAINQYNSYPYLTSASSFLVNGVTFNPSNIRDYYYTFSMFDELGNLCDLSVHKAYHCFNNKIGEFKSSVGLRELNSIVFFNKPTKITVVCHDNVFGANCKDLTFGDVVANNMFKCNASQCLFGQSFVGNTFDNDCNTSIFCSTHYINSQIYSFNRNTFSGMAYNNIFIPCNNNDDAYNTLLQGNTFLGGCDNNIFNAIVASSIFGNGLTNNNFKDIVNYSNFETCFQDNILDKPIDISGFGNFINNCHFYGRVSKSTLNDGVEDLYIDNMVRVNVLSGGYGRTQDTQYYPQGMFNSTENAIIGIDSNQDIKSWNPADLVP